MQHTHQLSLRRLMTHNKQPVILTGMRSTPDSSKRFLRLCTGWLMTLLMLTAVPLQAALVDGPSGAVNAIAKGADGTTYLGGSFTAWGTQTGGGAALAIADGAVNKAFPNIIGTVLASVSDGAGGVYIGGTFTSIGGLTRNNLARIDSTGAVTNWNPNANGTVNVLAISGNTVYIGGVFNGPSSINGNTLRNRLAAVDATTGTVTTWNPNASGIVNALAISGSTVYIGGAFNGATAINSNITRNYLAAVDTTNGTVNAWNPNASGIVNALAISGSTVYIGGAFNGVTAINSNITRNYLAAVDTTNGTVNAWNPNANGIVNALAISGTTVYVGGKFKGICASTSSCGSLAAIIRNKVAAISTDGLTLSVWDPNISIASSSYVNALAINGSTVYIAGTFNGTNSINGTTLRNGLAAVDATSGTVTTSWNPNPGIAAPISGIVMSTLSVDSNGTTVFAGGNMITTGGSNRNSLAALNAAGTLTDWNPNVVTGSVSALAVSSDTVYIGGTFTALCVSPSSCTNQVSTLRNNLAAVNTLTGDITAWNPYANSTVSTLGLSGSTVYAGGSFTGVCNTALLSSCKNSDGTAVGSLQTRNGLAAIDTNSTLNAWNPNIRSAASAGSVITLAISGNTLYAGGSFTGVCLSPSSCKDSTGALLTTNQTRYGLAAIGTDSTLSSWNPSTSGINALAISGSTVYVGGTFLNACTATGSCNNSNLNAGRSRLAAFGTDGSLKTWAPTNTSNTVKALAVSGNTVYIGGSFGTITANTIIYTRAGLAAIGSDGTMQSWNPRANNLGAAIAGTGFNAITISGNTLYTGATGGGSTGTSSQAKSISPLNFMGIYNTAACGSGVPITTGTAGVGSLWQMLALPCVPTTSTIAGALGTGTLSNLITANYATDTAITSPKIGWIIEERTVGATPAYSPLLSSTDLLSVGKGYLIKSYQAPTVGKLQMDGTNTPATVTQLQGCYSINGCKAITVTNYKAGANRYNLVGNPFAFPIDWSKVRIRVDGSALTLTPSAANTAGYINNTVNIWDGTTYTSFNDVSPTQGNLQYFKSFWVNVLPGAFGHTIELLIPAEQSTLSRNQAAPANGEQLATVAMPWYMGWLDWVVSPAAAAPVAAVSNHVNPQTLVKPTDWYIRLKVNNLVTGWKDHGALLGQLSDAQTGFDNHDVTKMAPFTAPYLTLVFPHPEWGSNAGDYASDFHPVDLNAHSWSFEVRANPVGSKVFLSWEGSPELLKRSQLIEVATGKIILPTDRLWAMKGYPITLKSAVQSYTWKVLVQ